jgi:hypothetical protein
MFKRISILLLTLYLITWLCGCSTQAPVTEHDITTSNSEIKNTVTVVVTRDFGKELILERDIELETENSAMEALQAAAEVETKYGGGFVSSINGIGSEYGGVDSKKKDWFFYINGIASKVGAGDYILRSGDIEHWDFRDWSYRQFIPAIIGDYPKPFWSGCKTGIVPTVVVYEEPFVSDAESLLASLRETGVSCISTILDDQLSEDIKQKSHLIIIATPENSMISELYKIHKKLGFYAYLEPGKILALDTAGNVHKEYGSGSGIIQATQNPWNPKGIGAGENVAWVVTGADVNGVKNAATALVNNQDELRYAFAAVVSEGEIVKIP